MRKIKFRGLSKDTGKMIHGILWNPNGCEIVTEELNESGDSIKYNYNRIEHKTLGQYIGFNDRNGNEIYEGDIIYIDDTSLITGERIKWSDVVVWDSEYCRFDLYNCRDGIEKCMSKIIEVTGNKHEDELEYIELTK